MSFDRFGSSGKIGGGLAACGIFGVLIPVAVQIGLVVWTSVILFEREVDVPCQVGDKDVASSF